PKDVNDPRLKEFERKESEHDVVHTATLERQNEQALLDKMREIDFIDAKKILNQTIPMTNYLFTINRVEWQCRVAVRDRRRSVADLYDYKKYPQN
ncbi:MAG: hypothetical protein GY943_04890, partial [Chloroflexi bacterium]|nr:hypothetical protein [Chloroflexota bacterium]